MTRDVDVAFSGAAVTLSGLLTDLNASGIVPRTDDAIGFAAQSQVLLARHAKTGVDVDVSLAWLPFEMEALSAASPTMLGAARLPVAQPEDLVIYKAVAWRPRDQQDIEHLLACTARAWISHAFAAMSKSSGEAMEEDRIQVLDALILRVLGR